MEKPVFNGKYKALTFSFDDGNFDDVRLIGIMNQYGLKGTFNLNSGKITKADHWVFADDKDVCHINYFEYPNLYDGHEVAAHSYTHPDLSKLDEGTAENEIRLDRTILKHLYGYDIKGFAYPFGTYNDMVIDVLARNSIQYARTVNQTLTFDLPENKMVWNPTCHFQYHHIKELAEKFLNVSVTNALFYIWGHSYELVTEEDWKNFEELCDFLGNQADVFYGTKQRKLRQSAVGT